MRASTSTSTSRDAGLTLVELMIAIALMLIITLQLQLVFGHSRKLFLGADAMAQVYSNARAALDQIERDVANSAKTDQMEFFTDVRNVSVGVGHFDKSGGKDETHSQLKGLRSLLVPGSVGYIHSMAFIQPAGYEPKDKVKLGFGTTDKLRRDAMYFKTFTTVDGQPREALVGYRLWIGTDPRDPRARPILQRIVIAPELDANGAPQLNGDGSLKLKRHDPQDICYYVQEFKVDLFVRDRRKKGAGRFYSAKEAVQKTQTTDDKYPPGLDNLLPGSEEVAVQCLDGKLEVDQQATMPTTGQDAGKLFLKNQDRLGRLGPGDKMYLLSRPIGNLVIDFQSSYVTVKEIEQRSPQETVVTFEEEETMRQYLSQSSTGGVPQLEFAYRGGWLPQAIRVQMKIKDQRSQEIRTITRIFQLLRA